MNLHPGAAIALQRLAWNELDIARAIAAEELASPQRYHNVTLYAIRITGTGVSYRPALNEFVYRKPENYLTDEFLARCNGLPVIWQHPEKSLLNSEEFAQRIIGTTFFPFIRDDEVWAIAKIYEDGVIELLKSEPMSTSPAVLLGPESRQFRGENGEKILEEDDATLLDHICLCPHGVWDKGGDATGVEHQSIDNVMARADAVDIAAASKHDDQLRRLDHAFMMIRHDAGILLSRQMRHARAIR